jgi:hypothetical protein
VFIGSEWWRGRACRRPHTHCPRPNLLVVFERLRLELLLRAAFGVTSRLRFLFAEVPLLGGPFLGRAHVRTAGFALGIAALLRLVLLRDLVEPRLLVTRTIKGSRRCPSA